MTLTKDPKTGTYKVRLKLADGSHKTVTTKTTNLVDAKKVAKGANIKDIELAAKSGKLTKEVIGQLLAGRRITLSRAIDEFLDWQKITGKSPNTYSSYGNYLRVFAKYAKLESDPPSSITEKHIDAWVNQKDDDLKQASRNNKLSVLKSFLDFAAAKGWTVGNPAKLVRVNLSMMTHAQKEPKQVQPFTDNEIRILLNSLEPGSFWWTATIIGRYTGLRFGDIITLEWDAFSKPGKMVVWTDKHDCRVELPIEEKLLLEAIAAIPIKDRQYVFPEERERFKQAGKHSAFSVAFSRACKRVNLFGRSFHSLRHTYCTEAARQGIPTPHISRNVGHRFTSTTEGYIHRD